MSIKKTILIVLAAILTTFAGLFVLGYGSFSNMVSKITADDKEEIENLTNDNLSAETIEALSGKMLIACFGVDSRDGSVDEGNSDTIMVVSIDNDTGEVKIVSVYRDTCLDIGNGKLKKANAAYASGGASKAVTMLNNNLDLQINDYITVNWSAVATAINILGGIDVDISEGEFKYINGYITENVDNTNIPSVHLEAPGLNHLDGIQALAYARIRYTDNDFVRTERQRLVIEKTLEKAKQADIFTINKLINEVIPFVSTSLNQTDILSLAANANRYTIKETTGFPFETTFKTINKQDFVFAVDLNKNVKELHKYLFDTEEYNTSTNVKNISDNLNSYMGKRSEVNETEEVILETVPETEPETTAIEVIEETTEVPEDERTDENYGPAFDNKLNTTESSSEIVTQDVQETEKYIETQSVETSISESTEIQE